LHPRIGQQRPADAGVGDKIVISVKDAIPAGGIKKGTVAKALLYVPKTSCAVKTVLISGSMTTPL
jgi:ribosomal protein L14